MFTDYKWWFVRRDDGGFITEAAVRFFEGGFEIVNGKSLYIRKRTLVSDNELKHLRKGVDPKNRCVYYTPDDFGQIKTDDELREFCNREISKDKSREVIKEQKWRV